MRSSLSLWVMLAGCSATSDFDYSFRGATKGDAGQEADATIDAAQSVFDAEAGVMPVDDGSAPDTALPDASCRILEVNESSCEGANDDDCDGLVDCLDSDCRQAPNCCPNPAPESGDTACTDKLDNDCDGIVDCAENGCKGVYECSCVPTGPEDETKPASCTDGNDNDCDRLTDCEENSGCAFTSICCSKQTVAESGALCFDGVNNDCDPEGADCADPDCRMSTDAGATASNEADCTDRLDNDCDGLVDCTDTDCRAVLACCESTAGQETRETSCNDGANNDCDTQGADCYDDDCAQDANCCRPVAGGERTMVLCTDRRDNDCDGLVDCDDPQCIGVRTCCIANLAANKQTLQSTETSCIDSYDNDCDGAPNCKDVDCDGYKGCGGVIIITPPVEAQ
jgi:hypothetical protein